MDQGLIRSLKTRYRRKIVGLCIKVVDKNEPLQKDSIFQAMKDLASSWNTVSKETVVNLFKKSDISELNQQMTEADNDDRFKSLIKRLTACQNKILVQSKKSSQQTLSLD